MRGTGERAKLMMEMLVMLLEDFAEMGQTKEAGPHVDELLGIAYRNLKGKRRFSRLNSLGREAGQTSKRANSRFRL